MLGSLLPMATTSLHEDREGHHRLRARSLRVSAIGAGLVLLATPISWFLVPLLFGSAYLSGRGPLVILMIATAVITFAAPLHPFAISSGQDRSYALILVCGAVGNVAANLVLIPLLGMTGAALTTLCAQSIVAALLWRLAHDVSRAPP
jgi:O-antigen/teichoic acid export membrane protein